MYKIVSLFIFLAMSIGGYSGHAGHRTRHCSKKVSEPFSEVLSSPIIISLNRHTHRFEETKAYLEKAGFTNILRFEAVDGFNTSDDFFRSLNILGGGPGPKGCAASHLLIWQDFIQDPHSGEYLFVLEDDALPHSNFSELFPQYWSETPEDFDLIMVGNQLGPYKEKIVRTPTFTTHAYIISKKGAKKLYNLYMQQPTQQASLYVIDIFLIHAMGDGKIKYYFYDSRYEPDPLNRSNAFEGRDTGLIYQNKKLGTSIHSEEIRY